MTPRDAEQINRLDPLMEDEGIPDHIGPLEEKARTGDAQQGAIPPGDRPRATADYGTTSAEQRQDETLGDRLAREQPDTTGVAAGGGVGRIVQPGGGEVDEVDTTGEEIGDETHDTAALTAEEAAVREAPEG